ncbi:MAG: hypothetical protein LQ350_001723 [Teloschistes chrysophthalmus]|nr:MAG: hypothetical protein LQ350_001723 [Niorma chrysophthalma]
MNYSNRTKWTITMLAAFVTLAVAFVSSAYSGGIPEIVKEFHTSEEVATLGIALYGRQIVLSGTYGIFTAFNAGVAGSQNIETLIILRFFAGAFGSSALTNSGGVIADLFPASQRGLALAVFACAPFTGPTLGPIVGGFVGETVGWRWLAGVMAIFTGFLWILGTLTIPETYAPLLLRNRASKLSRESGKIYLSKVEVGKPKPSLTRSLKIALSRPWVLLFLEPIVLLLSVYMVYQENRHWSQGIGSLPFLSVLIGMFAAVAYTIPDNKRYRRAATVANSKGGHGAPPEARLPPCMVGSVCLPLGLFIFAWTNYPRIHWIVSVMFTAPFGFGMVLLFLSIMNYLIDAYTVYAASVLAANTLLRSVFGAVFPLFTMYMYEGLGIHWASSVPAFLALACVPFPFLFFKYGEGIRMKCRYAREAAEVMEKLMQASKHGGQKGAGAVAVADDDGKEKGREDSGVASQSDELVQEKDLERGHV